MDTWTYCILRTPNLDLSKYRESVRVQDPLLISRGYSPSSVGVGVLGGKRGRLPISLALIKNL